MATPQVNRVHLDTPAAGDRYSLTIDTLKRRLFSLAIGINDHGLPIKVRSGDIDGS